MQTSTNSQNLTSFFHLEQTVYLAPDDLSHGESYTFQIAGLREDGIYLRSKYELQQLSALNFIPEACFSITTASLGLGLCSNLKYISTLEDNSLHFAFTGLSKMFQRRTNPRYSMNICYSITTEATILPVLLNQWSLVNNSILQFTDLSDFSFSEKQYCNISSDGVQLLLDTPLDIGFLVLFTFSYHQDFKPIVVIAEVVWVQTDEHSNKMRYGFRFIKFNPEHRRYLSDYLNQCAAVTK